MKRLLALILAFALIFALSACKGNDAPVEDEGGEIITDVPGEVENGEETDAPEVEEKEEAPEVKPEEKPQEKPAEKPADKPVEKPTEKPETSPEVVPEEVPEEKPEEKPAESKTLGDTLLSVFRANADKSAADIAAACITDEAIKFMGGTAPMEAGYLAGFDAEITGFDSCTMFAPNIGTIPFVGYVFEVSGDADAFVKTLKDNANPHWNICTEAEQTVCEKIGNKVFFLMCPKTLEE